MKLSPWIKYSIMLAVVFGVDYAIASFFAGDNKDDVWFYFALLIAIPLLFAIKATIVRLVLWYFLERRDAIANLVDEFSKNKWPKPNWDYSDGADYLQDVMNNTEADNDVRLLAAQMWGANTTLFQTQQIISALMSTHVLKNAVKQYDRIAKEPDED